MINFLKMFNYFRKPPHLKIGIRGENLAKRFLQEKGAEIITQNYHGKRGEIDIVALHQNTLLFVEVKTRTDKKMRFISSPSDAVGYQKQKKLRLTASEYLQKIKYKNVVFRFDVIEIILTGKRLKSLKWKKEFFLSKIEFKDDFEFE